MAWVSKPWKHYSAKGQREAAERYRGRFELQDRLKEIGQYRRARSTFRVGTSMEARTSSAFHKPKDRYGFSASESMSTRASRQRIARKRQRALIRAGLRARPVSRQLYYGSKATGYVDLTVATYALDTTGSITLIATVAQGAGVTQRIGKKILWKSIQMRGSAYSNSATTVTDAAWLIVYDKRPTGALPSIADILVSVNPSALNNDANAGRFKILRRGDLVFAGNTTAGQITSKSIYDQTEFIKVNKPGVFKAAGTGAIGDIEEGAIYLVTVGSTAAGTSAATLSAAFRVRFKDTAG